MNGTPTISVIMPVYNTGRYLREAVDSVLAQTFSDFELILIDDGSTDGSGAICDEYAAHDSRVRVKHGRNGGICASRNAGIDLVRGEWLTFCDHDDLVERNWLGRMHKVGTEAQVEVVKCNHTWQERSPEGRILTPPFPKPRGTRQWRRGDLRGEDGYLLFMDLASLVWDGLYRTDFWRRAALRFDPAFTCGGEDCYLGVDLLNAASGGVWLAEPLYHHYFNFGLSTASRFHPELLAMQLKIARHEKSVLGYSTAPELVAMFKRWSGHLRLFAFEVPGCVLTLREQAAELGRFYDEIVGRDTAYTLSEIRSPRLRLLAFFMKRRWFVTWLLLLRIRRPFKRRFG